MIKNLFDVALLFEAAELGGSKDRPPAAMSLDEGGVFESGPCLRGARAKRKWASLGRPNEAVEGWEVHFSRGSGSRLC